MRTHALSIGCAVASALLSASCTSPAAGHLPAEGALGPYSAAVSSGDLVFLSGKIGKAGGSTVGSPAGTIGQDVEAAIDSIEKDLDRLQLSLADVVSVNVFVTDMSAYAELNAAYAKCFPQPYPARTTVAVSALPGGARVEIQAVAARRRR
jgi:2-iminobutanoate/2-iminopropanoate deaminase